VEDGHDAGGASGDVEEPVLAGFNVPRIHAGEVLRDGGDCLARGQTDAGGRHLVQDLRIENISHVGKLAVETLPAQSAAEHE